MHFLSMFLRGIIAITNINGGSVSPGKIPLSIFTTARTIATAVSMTSFSWYFQ